MSSPFPTLLLCASYIYFVKSLGPRLMKNRAPFELRKTIIAYNVIQVVFSIWIVYKVSAILSACKFRHDRKKCLIRSFDRRAWCTRGYGATVFVANRSTIRTIPTS